MSKPTIEAMVLSVIALASFIASFVIASFVMDQKTRQHMRSMNERWHETCFYASEGRGGVALCDEVYELYKGRTK